MSLVQRRPQLPPPPTRERLRLLKVEPQSPPIEGSELPLAGFWMRYSAQMLDTLILSVSGGAVQKIVILAAGYGLSLGSKFFLPSMVLFQLLCIYFVYWKPLMATGQSYGKKFLNLRIVDVNGDDLRPSQIMRREILGKMASALCLGLGYLMAAGPRKLALHDRLYGTRVVRLRR